MLWPSIWMPETAEIIVRNIFYKLSPKIVSRKKNPGSKNTIFKKLFNKGIWISLDKRKLTYQVRIHLLPIYENIIWAK